MTKKFEYQCRVCGEIRSEEGNAHISTSHTGMSPTCVYIVSMVRKELFKYGSVAQPALFTGVVKR